MKDADGDGDADVVGRWSVDQPCVEMRSVQWYERILKEEGKSGGEEVLNTPLVG